MADTKIQVVNVSHIPLPPVPDRVVKLSLFDAYWIGLKPIQRLLLYHDADLPPFPDIVSSLKSSLSRTLSKYFPLAGKLTYLPSSRDVVIDCSTDAIGPGVEFLEAEAVEGDIRKLAGDEVHDLAVFLQLVPELDVSELPAPVFSVQVTAFGQGVAVGFSMHHAVADGKALWQFVEAWAAACRGEEGKLTRPAMVVEDRVAVISHPRGDEIARQFLQGMAPCLPKLRSEVMSFEDRLKLTRRTFVISTKNIEKMKQKLMKGHEKIAAPKCLTTFVTLSAYAWTTYVQSRCFKEEENVYFFILADCRSRLSPPVDEGYFGNCVKPMYAKAKASELLGENGHECACKLIQKCMDENLEEPLKGCENWVEMVRGDFDFARACNVASSHRFKVYDMTDFGFGKPKRVELVSMNNNGEHVLSGALEGDCYVQISVALDPVSLEAFAKHFVDNFLN